MQFQDEAHNSPNFEHLTETHKRMFNIIREKNPDLPIVIVSRPKIVFDDDTKGRLKIIENTYAEAI